MVSRGERNPCVVESSWRSAEAPGADVPMPTVPFCKMLKPAFAAVNPPAKVEVAVVEVAWKYSATIGPTTESLAYGEVVPSPRLPAALKLKRFAPLEEAMRKMSADWPETLLRSSVVSVVEAEAFSI